MDAFSLCPIGVSSAYSVAESRLFSSFQPPVPPQSQGQAVYKDINLSSAPQVGPRSEDPEAVFVVTGASRGIGLQFVKTLLLDTKVCRRIH